ncbi:porin [Oceanisphaera avium]|uniref:Porin domain-containing protein n=1 Tax=Oceanisphaera avium TaxID=1903694 RepID=A0A1Y0CV29_9GAMM|nr:porin [Oceanisphaera avium]ART79152.1 hypothetical protein CBP12_02480 [Oceanisphaera avium]
MKKTILALTIPALFATSAGAVEIYSAEDGSKVDLYGRLQYHAGGLAYKDAPNANDRESFGGEGQARLGVNVKYALDDATALIGKYEANFDAESKDNDNEIDTRYAWLGFRFMDTTDLTFGKSEAARAQLTDLTDTFDIFGGEVTKAGGYNRVDDQVRLAYAENGVDLRASYSFNDDRKDAASNANNENNRLGLSAGYTLPNNLGFVASYSQDKNQNLFAGPSSSNLNFPNADKSTEWGLGAHYTVDGFYFAGLYGERDVKYVGVADGGARFWELQAAYTVQEWTLLANYANQSARNADVDAAARESNLKIDEYTLAARYAFTPKTKVYAEYVINEVKGKDDLYGVGIQYNF